ncbi:MAG: sialate O-acetylesterase [bacterium]
MFQRITFGVIAVFFGVLSAISTPTFAEVAKDRVFVLAGQSNMQGRGASADLPAHLKQQPSNVRFYTHGRESHLAKYHYFGPEVNFAHLIANTFPNDNVIIIKSAASGSSITEWLPSKPLYDALIRQVKFVVDPENTVIQGIVWMQGETDAKTAKLANDYQQNLKLFIDRLREDLNAENTMFLIGRITQPNANFSQEQTVRNAQNEVDKHNPNTIIVPTDGLGKLYDNVHFNSEGLIELGRRFALAFVNRRKEILTEQMP